MINAPHTLNLHRLIATLTLLGAVHAHAEGGRYRIDVASDLSRFDVSACFEKPTTLVRPADAGRQLAGKLRIEGREPGRTLPGDQIRLERAGACLNYQVDVQGAARLLRYSEVARPGSDFVLLDPNHVLLLPQAPYTGEVTVKFMVPDGMAVSAPWSQAATSNLEYKINLSDYRRDWPALLAVGRMTLKDMEIAGTRLRLAILPGIGMTDLKWTEEWIRQGALAVAGAYGHFPAPAPQVMVVPVGSSPEPVPWGQVLRGGGVGAHMFIDEKRGLEEFRRDWVLVHELSHLLHPKFDDEGLWLAEGLASYYQNVLRARSGVLSEAEAWKKLRDGFLRGVDQTRDGETLVEASRAMHQSRRYMRVYWSGAALALAADVTLRGQGKSLDAALAGFHACCLSEQRLWSAGEFLAQLDRLSQTSVFTDLYKKNAHSDAFPDVWPMLDRLGVRASGDSLSFDEAAPASTIRREIMK